MQSLHQHCSRFCTAAVRAHGTQDIKADNGTTVNYRATCVNRKWAWARGASQASREGVKLSGGNGDMWRKTKQRSALGLLPLGGADVLD